jgi:hypothetical protein
VNLLLKAVVAYDKEIERKSSFGDLKIIEEAPWKFRARIDAKCQELLEQVRQNSFDGIKVFFNDALSILHGLDANKATPLRLILLANCQKGAYLR